MKILRKIYYFLILLFYANFAYSADSGQLTWLKQGVRDVHQVGTLIQGLGQIESNLGQAIPREYRSFKNETEAAFNNILGMFNGGVITRATPNLDTIFDTIEKVLEKSLSVNNAKFKDDAFKQFISTKKEEFARIRYNLMAPPPPEPAVLREPHPVQAPQPAAEPPVVVERVEVLVDRPETLAELERLKAQVIQLQQQKDIAAEEAVGLLAEKEAAFTAGKDAGKSEVEDIAAKQLRLALEQQEQALTEKLAREKNEAVDTAVTAAITEADTKTVTTVKAAEAEFNTQLAQQKEDAAAVLGEEREKLVSLRAQLLTLTEATEKRDAEDLEALTKSQIIRIRARKLVTDAEARLDTTRKALRESKGKVPQDFKEDDFLILGPKIKSEILDKDIREIGYDTPVLVVIRSLLNAMANVQQDLFGVNVANVAQKIELLQLPATSSDDGIKLDNEIDALDVESVEILQQKNLILDQISGLDDRIYAISVKEKSDKENLEEANRDLMSQSSIFTISQEDKDGEIANLERQLQELQKSKEESVEAAKNAQTALEEERERSRAALLAIQTASTGAVAAAEDKLKAQLKQHEESAARESEAKDRGLEDLKLKLQNLTSEVRTRVEQMIAAKGEELQKKLEEFKEKLATVEAANQLRIDQILERVRSLVVQLDNVRAERDKLNLVLLKIDHEKNQLILDLAQEETKDEKKIQELEGLKREIETKEGKIREIEIRLKGFEDRIIESEGKLRGILERPVPEKGEIATQTESVETAEIEIQTEPMPAGPPPEVRGPQEIVDRVVRLAESRTLPARMVKFGTEFGKIFNLSVDMPAIAQEVKKYTNIVDASFQDNIFKIIKKQGDLQADFTHQFGTGPMTLGKFVGFINFLAMQIWITPSADLRVVGGKDEPKVSESALAKFFNKLSLENIAFWNTIKDSQIAVVFSVNPTKDQSGRLNIAPLGDKQKTYFTTFENFLNKSELGK